MQLNEENSTKLETFMTKSVFSGKIKQHKKTIKPTNDERGKNVLLLIIIASPHLFSNHINAIRYSEIIFLKSFIELNFQNQKLTRTLKNRNIQS